MVRILFFNLCFVSLVSAQKDQSMQRPNILGMTRKPDGNRKMQIGPKKPSHFSLNTLEVYPSDSVAMSLRSYRDKKIPYQKFDHCIPLQKRKKYSDVVSRISKKTFLCDDASNKSERDVGHEDQKGTMYNEPHSVNKLVSVLEPQVKRKNNFFPIVISSLLYMILLFHQ
jgi:hypothetical protein